jgi:hypothetical protein
MSTESNTSNITVTVVGGGNSAHILIPFLSAAGKTVHLLTRRPDEWEDVITCEITDTKHEINKSIQGMISKKSKNAQDVIPQATVIIFCMPVHTQREVLQRIGPFIDKSKTNVYVGTIYGQAGFNWMVHEMEKEHNLTNVSCFAVGLIPWICRTIQYGSKAINYGGKQVNICAVTPKQQFDKLNQLILNDFSYNPLGIGKFVQACSFLSLTLSVDNQIVHPARCYGLWKTCHEGRWSSLDDVPYFYRDFDVVSANNVANLDHDYSSIRQAVKKLFPDRPFTYMLSYLDLERLTHSSENINIQQSFQESQQLGLIKTPTEPYYEVQDDGNEIVEYRLNTKCRFFTDDIPYGLLIAKWVGEQLNVDTPFIDEVITWSQKLRGEHWLKEQNNIKADDNGNMSARMKIDIDYCLDHKILTGIPPSYDLDSIEDILD